jgi:hypothetical protein
VVFGETLESKIEIRELNNYIPDSFLFITLQRSVSCDDVYISLIENKSDNLEGHIYLVKISFLFVHLSLEPE